MCNMNKRFLQFDVCTVGLLLATESLQSQVGTFVQCNVEIKYD